MFRFMNYPRHTGIFPIRTAIPRGSHLDHPHVTTIQPASPDAAAFSRFVPRLRQQVLVPDAPLECFFTAEQSWFDDMKDVRDAFCIAQLSAKTEA